MRVPAQLTPTRRGLFFHRSRARSGPDEGIFGRQRGSSCSCVPWDGGLLVIRKVLIVQVIHAHCVVGNDVIGRAHSVARMEAVLRFPRCRCVPRRHVSCSKREKTPDTRANMFVSQTRGQQATSHCFHFCSICFFFSSPSSLFF